MDRDDQPAVLMIAYHFPPLRGSSGIQRTLRFCRYLPEFGWRPLVLTAHPRAYESTSDDLLSDVPSSVPVCRAFAVNTASHLAIGKRYPKFLAVPDRWVSWWLGGVVSGLKLIRKHRVRAILSTYPIATAHLIGLTLQRLTGLPWIADFRDPMAQDGYPEDPNVWKSYRWIEERALIRSRVALFTSPGAIREYRRRYPGLPESRMVLLENGYDDEAFAGAVDCATPKREAYQPRRLVILHSGIVYTSERDPTHLFLALGELKRQDRIDSTHVELRFRASANDDLLIRLANENDVSDIVSILPPIPYRDALKEMKEADALLVMQASNCNSQIPAKVYEYVRTGRPIFALADPAGDTADLVRRAGINSVVPLDSVPAICNQLPAWIEELRSGDAAQPRAEFAAACSRRERTRELAGLLDRCTG